MKDYGADKNLVHTQETNHDSQTEARRISWSFTGRILPHEST